MSLTTLATMPRSLVPPAQAVEASLLPPLLNNATYRINHGQFCVEHWVRMPKAGLPACCQQPCQSSQGSPHFMYMHTEKTGGSSIECALQQAAAAGNHDLLGHANADVREACAARCQRDGVPTRTLITVRNPYTYWQSVFRYTWRCIFGACASAEANYVRSDPGAKVSIRESRQPDPPPESKRLLPSA